MVDGMQEGRTVNLGIDRLAASSGSHCRTGTTLSVAVPRRVPRSPPLFPRTAVKPLERAAYPSRVARFYEGWIDEWCEEPATHSCLHTPLFCHPPPLSPSLASPSLVVRAGVLSNYSPSERRANNNPAMTCSPVDRLRSFPLPRPLAREGRERE